MSIRRVMGISVATLLLLNSPAGEAELRNKQGLQTRPAAYADIHQYQSMGKIIVSPDGKFMVYEWSRPYLNWVPDTYWMAPKAAGRAETFLFKVDFTVAEPTSEYLFYPNGGASYWLGNLSPDNKHVAVYELDHDDNRVRAGVWNLADQKIKWFVPAPDDGRLEGVTAWISNEEFLYPAKDGKVKFIRANATTGTANPCPECSSQTLKNAEAQVASAQESAKKRVSTLKATGLPAGAKLAAGSSNGLVAVYVKDDAEVLSLMFVKPDRPVGVLFDNQRKWVPFGGPENDPSLASRDSATKNQQKKPAASK